MLAAAYILYREGEGVITQSEKENIIPTLGVVGIVALLWLLSVEVLDFFNRQIIALTNKKENRELRKY